MANDDNSGGAALPWVQCAALATPSLVNNESQFVSLNYRRWLGPHHGFIAEVNYLNLIEAYNKLGFSLGFFREY